MTFETREQAEHALNELQVCVYRLRLAHVSQYAKTHPIRLIIYYSNSAGKFDWTVRAILCVAFVWFSYNASLLFSPSCIGRTYTNLLIIHPRTRMTLILLYLYYYSSHHHARVMMHEQTLLDGTAYWIRKYEP